MSGLHGDAAALFAIDRVDISNYVSALIWVYTILIFIRVLLSWIPRMPYNPALSAVLQFVYDVTEPFLGFFRRIIPPIRIGGAGLDLSPILALITLYILRVVLTNLIAG